MLQHKGLTVYTTEELFESVEAERQERLQNGLQDGDFLIKFRKRDLSIQIERAGQEWYSIDLERCTTAGELLDLILHLHGKSWACSSSAIASILTVIDDACVEIFGKGTQTLMRLGEPLNWRQSKR